MDVINVIRQFIFITPKKLDEHCEKNKDLTKQLLFSFKTNIKFYKMTNYHNSLQFIENTIYIRDVINTPCNPPKDYTYVKHYYTKETLIMHLFCLNCGNYKGILKCNYIEMECFMKRHPKKILCICSGPSGYIIPGGNGKLIKPKTDYGFAFWKTRDEYISKKGYTGYTGPTGSNFVVSPTGPTGPSGPYQNM